ncbi:hypothetical protein H5398_08490 [Tessaracoccus sp. MC1679]|uniref:hypothetical protein n=1 Tax=Tessaracoccus sp. MC1679 TaxID=2760313 RepID=UPI0016038BB7|nr:hypothetical protein [Tessaracoccus sp. MC1679]MBB1516003.1 hypothetical protein [Tessaracoccus sp. MC1679]
MDVVELLGAVRLVDVRTIQEVAELKLDPAQGNGLSALDETSTDGELTIDINPVHWGARIEIWFRARFETPSANLVAAVAVIYERDIDDEVPEDTRTDFIEKVAIMAAYPYLRGALQGLAGKMRMGTFTLDVLRQGEFTMAASEADDSGQ